MNVNGYARAYVTRNQDGEQFLKYVSKVIEQQLKEWDGNYEVIVMKLKDHEFIVKKAGDYYHIHLSEKELELLLKSGSYQLDRKLWMELENQGLTIIKGTGDYLEMVL
ncbi:hypothetical protein [Bacillus sp. EB600]|uniref:hypothetical protein n=1 Tax=Bacillus sp. EB600 TaxID=2806345 RepID=UPI00210AA541|nr:hypothetical protein [Bacillus sp. EB600]MCQ6279666.1 hypothetical protein [Bacillus sp. EB600]